MMSLMEGVPDCFIEDGRHSRQGFENAIKEVEKFREPQWGDQKVEGIGPHAIWLRDEKYKYRYDTKTGRLNGVEIAVSDKALDKQMETGRYVPVTWRKLN